MEVIALAFFGSIAIWGLKGVFKAGKRIIEKLDNLFFK